MYCIVLLNKLISSNCMFAKVFLGHFIPPAIVLHVTEDSVHHAGYELTSCDKQGVYGDQLTPELRRRHFSDIDWDGHRCYSCGGKPTHLQ